MSKFNLGAYRQERKLRAAERGLVGSDSLHRILFDIDFLAMNRLGLLSPHQALVEDLLVEPNHDSPYAYHLISNRLIGDRIATTITTQYDRQLPYQEIFKLFGGYFQKQIVDTYEQVPSVGTASGVFPEFRARALEIVHCLERGDPEMDVTLVPAYASEHEAE